MSEDALLSGLISSVAKANNVLKSPINWSANDSTKSSPSSGTTRFTTNKSSSINMGGYWFYDTSVVVPGKRYLFQTKVRGKNCTLIRAGEQGDTDRGWSVPLNDEWQTINFVFDARRDIVIYASVSSSDAYLEIDDSQTFVLESGGVAIPNLATVTSNTLEPQTAYPRWVGFKATNLLKPGRYYAAYRTDGLATDITRVRIANIATTSDVSPTFGGINITGNKAYVEFTVPDNGNEYVVYLLSSAYNVPATKNVTFSDIYIGKLSDQVGGVTKPLDLGSPTVWKGVSLVDAIQLAKFSASGAHDQQEVLTYHLGQKLEPSTKYRISFVARGSGDLNTYLFPGVASSQDGQRSDGRIITSLTGDFRDYSYEVTTYANFSGDTDKQLLFRFPADSKAGWVDIYIGSVRVEKVGGVAKTPSQPQAAGLLYTGLFTVSTGSTPAWGYKEIPVGNMDGDTLTVTLTIHQTAGAKLDQICVALYDSKITKPLATYAYPATEQTNTITIVDKLPDKNAKLLFYANDKTTNTNTTVEFSDVTIVGS